MEDRPRDGRDGSAKSQLCNDVEAMHNLHFLATIEIEPGSKTAAYLHRLKVHLDRVTDALCP
jgi:hypothetical protein